MFTRKVIGIYLESNALHYLVVRAPRWGAAWYPQGLKVISAGIVEGTGPGLLNDFLSKLSSSKQYDIYLVLHRNVFSARDTLLPPMPPEDALQAVQSSMAVYSHLPLEEIYCDIHFCRTAEGKINALIFYAPRKVIDSYRDIFDKTGQRDSLKGIFPVSYGIGAGLALQKSEFPVGMILEGDESCELAVFGKKGCLLSMTWACHDEEAKALLVAMAQSKFHVPPESIIELNRSGSAGLASWPESRLKQLPPFTENLGTAALAPVLCGRQQLSIDEQPTRIKQFPLMRSVIAGGVLLAILLSLLTLHAGKTAERQEQNVAAFKRQIRQLTNELQPLEEKMAILRNSAQAMEDIEAFIKTRPPLFSCINEIARLVPEGTWFSRLNFAKDVLTLRGESKDALKVVDALRKSEMFESVKLQGAVSRTPKGEDRFGLTIELKKTDDGEP